MEGAAPAALYAEAVKHFEVAEKTQETTRPASFHELWGIALLRTGQASRDTRVLRQAVERFAKALELNPDDPILHYNIACAYSQLHQLDQALRHLQRALERDPQETLRASADRDPFLEPLRRTDAFRRLVNQPRPAAGQDERPTVSEK
ncbi:tetratricopeptide repeat protein [bacterium]|nr:tetratricopeptide repeat protein [bacterium]